MATPWWKRDSQLLTIEMDLARRATNGRIARAGDTLVFEEDVVADGIRFGLRIQFPDNYPYEPPRVFLAYPELPVTVEIHRFSNGALCLHGEEEWSPLNSIIWIRNRAVAWIGALLEFQETGEWPAMTPE